MEQKRAVLEEAQRTIAVLRGTVTVLQRQLEQARTEAAGASLTREAAQEETAKCAEELRRREAVIALLKEEGESLRKGRGAAQAAAEAAQAEGARLARELRHREEAIARLKEEKQTLQAEKEAAQIERALYGNMEALHQALQFYYRDFLTVTPEDFNAGEAERLHGVLAYVFDKLRLAGIVEKDRTAKKEK